MKLKQMLARLVSRTNSPQGRYSDSNWEQWCKLRNHLRSGRFKKGVPRDYLEEPEWHTKPGVRLVAYFSGVKQKPVGRAAKFSTLSLTLALYALMLALLASVQAVQTAQSRNTASKLDDMACGVHVVASEAAINWDNITSGAHAVVAVGLAIGLTLWSRNLHSVKAPFYLDLEELSLELPTGSRHARWRDVYSVSSDPQKPGWLRVELRDGVAALVHLKLEAKDRKLLEELMVELILQHR